MFHLLLGKYLKLHIKRDASDSSEVALSHCPRFPTPFSRWSKGSQNAKFVVNPFAHLSKYIRNDVMLPVSIKTLI